MKRIELIRRLNQLTLRYNLTWDEIKYDVDMAINMINNLLGTNYPPATQIYLNDESTYSERVGDFDVPIIKDEYFHTVIIPFIALEVLARDEEFTTVFSKYQQDLEEGKFHMISNEFAFVPDKYKRNRAEGVVYPSGNLYKNTAVRRPGAARGYDKAPSAIYPIRPKRRK